MTPAFLRALEKTLGFEGGYANVPGDRGGATNYGVTQKTYDAWRRTTGQTLQQVELIGDNEVRAIYQDNYWNPCHCDDLPEPLAHVVFDMAVNSGVFNAVLTLQRALGVRVDGLIGAVTLESAAQTDPKAAAMRFLKKRGGFIQDVIEAHPEQVKFLEGWIARLLDQT